MVQNILRKSLLMAICMVLIYAQAAAAQFSLKKHVRGKLESDVYTSPEKDFQIHVPMLPFGWMEDEASSNTDSARQVVFTDIMGSYYSAASYPASQDMSLDEALLRSGIVHRKEVSQTVRGREWRVISVYPGGSNLEDILAGTKKQLDLVTMSAVFAANNRTYRITAGVTRMKDGDFEVLWKNALRHLEDFLTGFKALSDAQTENKVPDIAIKKEIRGTFNHDAYTSSLKDYHVQAPRPFRPGITVRDESEKVASEVIFSDDFGGFYRVVSFNAESGITLESSLRALKEPLEQKEVQTARGKEFRIINVERNGAEVSIKMEHKPADSKAGTPDLVTANAAFMANGRVYHVIAGAVNFDESGMQAAKELAQRRLERFLSGFEPLPLNAK
jgi:hypothetical protein